MHTSSWVHMKRKSGLGVAFKDSNIIFGKSFAGSNLETESIHLHFLRISFSPKKFSNFALIQSLGVWCQAGPESDIELPPPLPWPWHVPSHP